jgi:hypothetical protein
MSSRRYRLRMHVFLVADGGRVGISIFSRFINKSLGESLLIFTMATIALSPIGILIFPLGARVSE